MKNVKIGGVPEHFNLAWHLTIKSGAYQAENINLRWQDYPEGTGAMCKGLRAGDIDIAILLTEGIVKDIIAGNPSKIVQTFVQSPLIWGVHVANNSKFETVAQLKGRKAAISRYGSGSHLMTYVNAENYHWNLDTDLNFEIINNLEGAVKGLTEGKADYFLWEKFMTKPIVDQGVFRRISDCPTPWPCFVIAAREDFIKNHEPVLKSILDIINKTTADFKSIPSIDKTIANRYNLHFEDVQDWLNLTEWSQELIDEHMLIEIQQTLFKLGIIPKTKSFDSLTHRV
ncbi:substrate-binding domain-containing protein [Pseudotamlana carrageenivorans]|uniref:ABC transporter substrate-binding protein n=1 Tax=Pseudotamlana carrageenivorans TaxID=2069432 RepID=A0A2I7SLB4_9FLAO|nr:substrate-binding domain-containing protein [Tamlana carrageenivorans]AUS06709.1 ABC transporter substrate-binding protein [Tamlana carrageenivorans]